MFKVDFNNSRAKLFMLHFRRSLKHLQVINRKTSIVQVKMASCTKQTSFRIDSRSSFTLQDMFQLMISIASVSMYFGSPIISYWLPIKWEKFECNETCFKLCSEL